MKLEFFTSKAQLAILLAVLGMITIKTYLYVQLIHWYSSFYDYLSKHLVAGGHGELFWSNLLQFVYLTVPMMTIMIAVEYLMSRYSLIYRQQACKFYEAVTDVEGIENVPQRIQEDTMKVSKFIISLGVPFIEAVAIIIAFFPLLAEYTDKVPETFLFGTWEYGLVAWTVGVALVCSGIAWWTGRALPGLEYKIQAVEADYRNALQASQDTKGNWGDINSNYLDIFLRYFYFNTIRYALIQTSAIIAYVALAPSIIAASIGFGTVIALSKLMTRLESSVSFFLKSWDLIVQLQSCTKRLKELK